MKILSTIRVMIVLALIAQSCVSLAPVNSSFDNATLIKKGEVEVSTHYSEYYDKYYDDIAIINRNWGVKLGLGLTKNTDLKIRYENLIPRNENYNVNFFSLTPRFNVKRDKSVFNLPLGVYWNDEDYEFIIGPGFSFNRKFSKHFELNYHVKIDAFLNSWYLYAGSQLGAGFSNDLSQWAIRPEIGFMKDIFELDNGTYLTYGLGICFYLNRPPVK